LGVFFKGVIEKIPVLTYHLTVLFLKLYRRIQEWPKNMGFLSYILLCLVLLSGVTHAVFAPDYEEIQEPSVRTVVQSMRAHQIQWNLFALYTMNVDTPGYVETGGYNISRNGRIEIIPFYRWRAGPIVETFQPLDFSVDANNRGFFQVLLPTGLGYTRDGRFTLTRNRKLVMIAGNYPVLGERGEIYLPEGKEIAVSKSGQIYVDGTPVDKLKVVVFKDMSKLETLNGSLFYLTAEAELIEGEEHYAVHQGFLEQNNVLKALIGDITMASRTYEATSKVGRSITKMLNSVVQLGNP